MELRVKGKNVFVSVWCCLALSVNLLTKFRNEALGGGGGGEGEMDTHNLIRKLISIVLTLIKHTQNILAIGKYAKKTSVYLSR